MIFLKFLRLGPSVSSVILKFPNSIVHIPGPENVVSDALSPPSSIVSPFASPLVSLSRVDRIQDPGLTPFGEFLPRSDPSLLFPTPSSSSFAPVISCFDISLLPLLQLTCPSVSKMFTSPTLSVVSVPLKVGSLLHDSSTVLYTLWFLFSCDVNSSTYSMMLPTLVFVPLGD